METYRCRAFPGPRMGCAVGDGHLPSDEGQDWKENQNKADENRRNKGKSRWEAASGMASGAVCGCGCANWRRGEGGSALHREGPINAPLKQVSVEPETSQNGIDENQEKVKSNRMSCSSHCAKIDAFNKC